MYLGSNNPPASVLMTPSLLHWNIGTQWKPAKSKSRHEVEVWTSTLASRCGIPLAFSLPMIKRSKLNSWLLPIVTISHVCCLFKKHLSMCFVLQQKPLKPFLPSTEKHRFPSTKLLFPNRNQCLKPFLLSTEKHLCPAVLRLLRPNRNLTCRNVVPLVSALTHWESQLGEQTSLGSWKPVFDKSPSDRTEWNLAFIQIMIRQSWVKIIVGHNNQSYQAWRWPVVILKPVFASRNHLTLKTELTCEMAYTDLSLKQGRLGTGVYSDKLCSDRR